MKISIVGKLVIALFLFIAPITYLVVSLVAQQQISIDFAQKEIIGNSYLAIARQAQLDLWLNRRPGAEIAQRIKAAEEAYGPSLDTAKQAASAERSLITGTNALAAMRALIARIGDQSNLILDPDLDTYYTTDVVLGKVPDLIDQVAQLRDLATKTDHDDSVLVDRLVARGALTALVDGLEGSVQSAFAGNPDGRLKAALEADATRAVDALKAVIAANVDGASTVDRTNTPTEAMATLDVFTTHAATELTRMLTLRVDRFVHHRIETLAVASLGFLLALLVVALFLHRGVIAPLRRMTEAMRQLAGGAHDIEIVGQTRADEIGEMARAVLVFQDNAVAKKRQDELETQRLFDEREAADAKARHEQMIAEEIATLIGAVAAGDLSKRIDLAGKDGFYRTMSDGINRLTDTVAAVIDDLAGVLSALASGDLEQRVSRDYQGAFQRLKEDVNATSARLATIVSRISNAAEQIAQVTDEVANDTTNLSDRTEQQASSLEETAASMEELGATVRSNADNAQRANKMAEEARLAAESGGKVAGEAVSAMKRIEEASRKITDIIGVIDEIAFQTNLLALNAAVEAARAGDAGRGFAVVAQEVRNLAQRSAQASKEIKALILDSDGQVQDGVDLVKKAGAALEGIVGGVQQVASLIASMATASTEQAVALDEINATVAQMDEMTQKNAAMVEETIDATREMARQANDLKAQIGFFRFDNGIVAGM